MIDKSYAELLSENNALKARITELEAELKERKATFCDITRRLADGYVGRAERNKRGKRK